MSRTRVVASMMLVALSMSSMVKAASTPVVAIVGQVASMVVSESSIDLDMYPDSSGRWRLVYTLDGPPSPTVLVKANCPVWIGIDSTGFDTASWTDFENPLNESIHYVIKYPSTKIKNLFVTQSVAPKGKGYLAGTPILAPEGFEFTWNVNMDTSRAPLLWNQVPAGLNTDTITFTLFLAEPDAGSGRTRLEFL